MAEPQSARGRFVWPSIVDAQLKLTPAQMSLLIEGIDWRRTVAPEPPAQPRLWPNHKGVMSPDTGVLLD